MTKVTLKESGALRIEGDFELVDHEGNRFDLGGRTSISLCRCGGSQKKPFCDGSHTQCGFDSSIHAYALPPKGN